MEKGSGTFVSSGRQTISASERKKTIGNILREAAVGAIQLDISLEQVQELLVKEYNSIKQEEEKNRSKPK
jgi:DNA-binding transcriptional regulator YhcF (GntR family)